MRTSPFRFHSDPSHAWLEVTPAEIAEAGITDRISHYSYASVMRGAVYLEEDSDAPLFIAALAGMGVEFNYTEHNSSRRDSFVRGCAGYSPEFVRGALHHAEVAR
jgi:hypothetical protein